MKAKLSILVLLLCLLLSGCFCKHEWTESDCENPQICTKCQEIGMEALGHSWRKATCTESDTCTRCGAAQGDALGHSYGEWTFREDQMSHTCSVCAFEEITEIDRELYLETLLPGYWDFFGMYDDTGFTEASKLKLVGIEFHFGADSTFTFSLPDTGTQQGTWYFDSYQQEDGADSYYFTLKGETQTYSMCLRHDPSGKQNQPEKELLLLSSQLLMFGQYDSLEKYLVTNWGIKNSQWGTAAGNPGNWITFRNDRTVVGNLNGAVDGIWHVIPIYSATDWQTPSSYGIVIENNAGTEPQLFKGTLSVSNGTSLKMDINGSYQTFDHISGQALETIQTASEIHLGTWTSTCLYYTGEAILYTTDHSITFYDDGTFTADIGQVRSGIWYLNEIVDTTFYYRLYFGERRSSTTVILRTYNDDIFFELHNYPGYDQTYYWSFDQLTEDEAALFMQFAYQPIGTWFSQDPEDNDSFTFREDFTFSGTLNGEEISGTWYYRDYYFNPEKYNSDPENHAEVYRLNVDGSYFAEIWIRTDAFHISGETFIKAE